MIALRTGFILGTTMFALAVAGEAAADEAKIKRGQEVYAAHKCQMCHAIAGKGSKVSVLDGVGKRLSEEDIRKWITHPVAMTAKTKSTKKPLMPAKYTKLPAADLDALVAYLQSLK